MGIVHHSYYIRYFERGRVEFLRQAGILYRDLADAGIHFPVLRTECQHRRPLRFDDIVVVESVITELSKTRLCFAYRALKSEKEILNRLWTKPLGDDLELSATGYSEHCCLAPDGKPQRIPSDLLETLTQHLGKNPKEHDHYKIKTRN